ncbi:MAG TPA: hypothetical protein VHD62_16085 [Opitutaceae bacterium]|nr:hypothetical protein [Opitutaceae bacterium]
MRFIAVLALACSAAALRAEIPPLLDEAWTKYVEDIDHWAFTETTHAFDAQGKQTRESVMRYDPSRPYAEQFTIVSNNGKPPTEKEAEQARQRGIRRGERLERPGGQENDAQPRIVLNGRPALADLAHAAIAAETPQSVTFAVPLHAEGGKASSVEKFQTLVRVSKTTRAFERVEIQLPSPLRMNLLVKMNQADFAIDFTSVDPKFSPTATRLTDHAAISVFFRKREGGHEFVRSDFKRVAPYRDRFGVKIGPLRTIDF